MILTDQRIIYSSNSLPCQIFIALFAYDHIEYEQTVAIYMNNNPDNNITHRKLTGTIVRNLLNILFVLVSLNYF